MFRSSSRFFLKPRLSVSIKASSGGGRPRVSPGRIVRVTLSFAVLLLLAASVALATGAGGIAFSPLAGVLRGFLPGSGITADPTETSILLSIRLPRVLLAGIVGAALSSSGVIFQALLRNPLADPYILGISGGAALGAVIGISFGAAFASIGVPGLAFGGALVTIFLIFSISRTSSGHSGTTLLLTGVIINAFFSALIMFFVSISTSGRLHSILFWLMGNLSLAQGYEIASTATALLTGFLVMFLHARPLNLLALGDETAMQLGVDTKKTKVLLLVTASLVTATAVSASGTIGFIGLIIPHMLRFMLGPDHRLLLPASVLFGATFLIVTDTIARSIMAPFELPVGVVTALCGAPYFLYLMRRRTF
ncbi:MAG: iron chelate uptake ABC transporter family permease subunit [Syntrophales bacterium]|nr:iron chelate uptake ABC transporter family permease subunit [Syntrophales bacterium]